MSPRAVLFDLDGVLVDSFGMWFNAMNEVAAELGCPPIGEDALRDSFGQGVEEDLRTFYRGVSRPALATAYERAVARNVRHMAPNPHAAEALEDLAHRGIGRALVTNTQASAVPAVLAACRLQDHFEAVFGVTDDVREKPAPDLLHAACSALAVLPGEALMVGDSDYDRKAAAAAGVPYLHYELRSGADLRTALAASLIPPGPRR